MRLINNYLIHQFSILFLFVQIINNINQSISSDDSCSIVSVTLVVPYLWDPIVRYVRGDVTVGLDVLPFDPCTGKKSLVLIEFITSLYRSSFFSDMSLAKRL
jgi:hypothetical protein